MNRNIIILCITGFLIACMLGFGSYAAYEYSQRNVYESDSYTCGNFDNITNLVMTKKIWSIWHWEYASNNAYFRQRCPTFEHDASIYNNGLLVARTDGKILTVVSEMNIKDCHGNIIYTVESGNLFQTIINSNNIWTSLIVKDTNGTIFAYVTTSIFIVGTITFNDIFGNPIAIIDKAISINGWKWTYTIYNQSAIDMEVLLAITAKLSFSPGPGEKNDKTDMCNQFFVGAGVTTLILISLLLIIIIVFVIDKCTTNKKSDCEDPYNELNHSDKNMLTKQFH